MSLYTSTTVKSISSTRRRTRDDQQPNRKPSAPLRQRQEKAEERHRKQEEQDLAVSEWHASTLTKANELGERFGKKPRYFLDQFYSGGARMVHHHEKVNPHNAFKSLKARELRDGEFTLRSLFYLLTCGPQRVLTCLSSRCSKSILMSIAH